MTFMVTFDWKHALKLLLHTLSTTLISILHDSIPFSKQAEMKAIFQQTREENVDH
jgi:hypothetical protein